MLAKFRRISLFIPVAFVFSTLLYGLLTGFESFFRTPWATDGSADAPPIQRGYHLLMPATKSSLNFCRTLLTMTILGYPRPRIVGWGEADNIKGLIGGGSHYAKVTGCLDYVNDPERRSKPGFEDDIIFLFDSYDVWFQLPFETLVARYDTAIAEENERLAQRLGRAKHVENITASIIFAGGKRCHPNQRHTVGCYAVPDSPVPKDIHGGATDTPIGNNGFSSFRTRYLVGGYWAGPVRNLRPLLELAKNKIDECMADKGEGYESMGAKDASAQCYKGSDQSIFVDIFGRQEFHREVMRRHHRRLVDNILDTMIPDRPGCKPPATNIYGAEVDDILNPSFPHEEVYPGYLPGKRHEYGIAIDYFSQLGHQTGFGWDDARYIRQSESLEAEVGGQTMFDCKPKLPSLDGLPKGGVLDMMPGRDWSNLPLYTEICVGSAPVMIHHNNFDKSQIKAQWGRTWWLGHARKLMETRQRQGLALLSEGIPTDKGDIMMWDDLCPARYDNELYRGFDKEKELPDVEPPDLNPLTIEPLKAESPTQDLPQNEPLNDNLPMEDPPKEDSPKEDPPSDTPSKDESQEEDHHEGAIKDEPLREAPKNEAPKEEPPMDESLNEHPQTGDPPKEDYLKEGHNQEVINDDLPKNEPPKDDAPNDEPPKDDHQDESIKDEPPNDDHQTEPPKDDSPNDVRPMGDSPNDDHHDEPLKDDTPNNEPHKDDTLTDEHLKDDNHEENAHEDEPQKAESLKNEPPGLNHHEETITDEPPKDQPPKDEPLKDEHHEEDGHKDQHTIEGPPLDALKGPPLNAPEGPPLEEPPKDDAPNSDIGHGEMDEENDLNVPEDPVLDEPSA
ncbi:hypothetical protein G7Z17_g6846 [Cylindrodendrum hubeiense]|uniref:Uncharacterized protein n=1 Tax=Cylindrodendrum hubeiense TaxID=595255 RepID=A0A9P5LGC6_9HYPO|nr:hypothetical protein G7Z17_g6846 [Cylindrodendrum hubeiense]